MNIKIYVPGSEYAWRKLHYLRQKLMEINESLNLKAVDYIIKRRDDKTAVFCLDALLDAKGQGVVQVPYLDNGKYECYELSDLLDDAFGMANVEESIKQLQQESSKDAKVPTTERVSNVIYNNCNLIYGPNEGTITGDGSQVTIGYTADNVMTMLQRLLEHEDKVTKNTFEQVIELFKEQNDALFSQIAAEMQQAQKQGKSWVKVIRERLQDISAAITIGGAAVTVVPKFIALVEKLAHIFLLQ